MTITCANEHNLTETSTIFNSSIENESTQLAQELVAVITVSREYGLSEVTRILDGEKTNVASSLDLLCATPLLEGYRVSPLMAAAILYQSEIVKTLIRAGADVNFTDMFGRNALIRLILTSMPLESKESGE